MEESNWWDCDDPFKMLQFVQDKVSTRQLRLIAVACCRRVGEFLDDDFGLHSLEVAEQCADGLISLDELFNTGREWDFALNYDLHRAHATRSGLKYEAVGSCDVCCRIDHGMA
ncbi:MAG: hypothetical protein JWM11_2193 [Planctomycetaceae bacterium]|nr:hypothetical protein [Planctomycetaceae bacterium]